VGEKSEIITRDKYHVPSLWVYGDIGTLTQTITFMNPNADGGTGLMNRTA